MRAGAASPWGGHHIPLGWELHPPGAGTSFLSDGSCNPLGRAPHPSQWLPGSTRGALGQHWGCRGGAGHRQQGLGYPPHTTFTPSASQPGLVAVSSLPAHLPLAATKPFLWVSGSLVLQVIFKRAFSHSSFNKCSNKLAEMC